MDFENLPEFGLAGLMLLAGLSKFVMSSLWAGFEPRVIVELLRVTSQQLMLLGGAFEAALGAAIIYEDTRETASLLTMLWLTAITLRTLQLGAYSIAIRDFGLVMYAATVYLRNR
ncbi:MAG: hypothetical protein ABEJ98_03890 [Candidatus Nanohaloarchaea archaeon]